MSMAVLTTAFAGVLSSTPTYAATPADACFTMSGSTITAYTVGGANGCPTNVDIPAAIGGVPVTAISDAAFAGRALTAVTFPSSLTTIGHSAFTSNLLTTVVIPNTVTTMGTAVFGGMPSLTSATWNTTLTTIPASTFNSSGLTSFTVPAQVTTIGDGAFAANKLTAFTIPPAVTTIGVAAFQGNQLTSVTIPNSVTSLGVLAFLGNNISSLTIGSGLTTIPMAAFAMNALTTVTVPSTITTIDMGAFSMQVDDPVAYYTAAFTGDTAVAAAQYATMYYTQLFTADPSNPAGLIDDTMSDIENVFGIDADGSGAIESGINGGGHIVNPASITTNYVDTAGATLSPSLTATGTGLATYMVTENPTSDVSLYYRLASTQVLNAPAIAGYSIITPTSPYTATLAARQNTVNFVYSNPVVTTTPTTPTTPATPTTTDALAETGINAHYALYSAAALLLAAGMLLTVLKKRHA
jgi:hypothetical protein